MLLAQFGDRAVVHVPVRLRYHETIAVAGRTPERGLREAAQPERRMGFLERFRRHLDVLEVEACTLQGHTFSGKNAAHDLQGCVGARPALLEGHTETFELFSFEAKTDTELEPTARDDIDDGDILGQAHGVVKRHQEHPGRDADPLRAGSDCCSDGHNRREIAVVDEVVLRHPYVVEAVVLAPRNLIENFTVEPVGGLAPLGRIAEVVPQTKAYLSTALTHGLTFRWNSAVPHG